MAEKNKVVVITGGNRGIGADITRRFLDSGYLVVNISRQLPNFSDERLINYTADLADPQATRDIGMEIANKHAVTDFIHNAGVIRPDLLEDVKLEDLDYLTQLHLGSAITLGATIYPGHAQRTVRPDHPHIIPRRTGAGYQDELCRHQSRSNRYGSHLGAGTG